MILTVIELSNEKLPDDFWKEIVFYLPWKTEYLMLKGLTFDDSIMFLN